jgi:hypothetical protein
VSRQEQAITIGLQASQRHSRKRLGRGVELTRGRLGHEPFPGGFSLGLAQTAQIDHREFAATTFVNPQLDTIPLISNSVAQRFVTISDFADDSFRELDIQRSLELKAGRRGLQWSVVFPLIDEPDFLKRRRSHTPHPFRPSAIFGHGQ